MTTRNKPAFGAALCLGALLLTACGPGSPEAGRPNTAPPPSQPSGSTSGPGTSAPTTDTPTAPPTRPAPAVGSNLAAGEAFIGFYVDLLNYSYVTGDPAGFLAESDKGCVGCNALADYVKKVNARNGTLKGDFQDRLVDVKEIHKGEKDHLGGSATLKTGAYEEIQSPGGSPVPQAAGTGTMEFTLSRSGDNWVMYEMQIDE
ncbi:DUF6318 family protein [Kribbella sp. NPDC056951]|uniref:DUF6318 family protein n=1 Tax=Kribbella sp. NPDC056951 TaxID=3345978 RepID=UPI003642865D